MKDTPSFITPRCVALLSAVATFFAIAQSSPAQSSSFYRPLTLAQADESHGGGEGGGANESEDLAKKTQNPVSDLISVPFQNNFNFGIGPNNATQWLLNVQPVIPVQVSEDWNVISRVIIPIVNQPSPASGIPSAFGLSDINPTFFLSPHNPGKLIWGIGPTFTFPTATTSELGLGKWSAGPSVVVLVTPGHWVIGALANNQWSFAGWGDHSVNGMIVQPFVNYNFKHGWYFTTAPLITANWKADSDERWTVPVGGGFGKIIKFQKHKLPPLNVQLAGYWNAKTPETFGADWQLRFQVALLFPEKKK